MNTEAKVRESIRRAHQQNGGKFIDAVCDAAFDAVDQGKALGWPESTLRGIIAGYIRMDAARRAMLDRRGDDAREEREAAEDGYAKRSAEVAKEAFQWEAKSAEDGYAKRSAEVAKAAEGGDWKAVATASEAMAEAAGRLDAIRRVTTALNAGGMDAARRAMLDVLMAGNGITHMGVREAAAQQFRSGRVAMVARIDSMVGVLG